MTEISVGFTIVIPGSVDPGMHFGLEVKRLNNCTAALQEGNKEIRFSLFSSSKTKTSTMYLRKETPALQDAT